MSPSNNKKPLSRLINWKAVVASGLDRKWPDRYTTSIYSSCKFNDNLSDKFTYTFKYQLFGLDCKSPFEQNDSSLSNSLS